MFNQKQLTSAIDGVNYAPPKTTMDTQNDALENGVLLLNMAIFGIYLTFPGSHSNYPPGN